MDTPNVQVVEAFHGDSSVTPEPLGPAWDNGWRYGQVALARAVGQQVAWSSRVREKLQVTGVQIARPVRSSDGRFLTAGWRATGFVPGEPQQRVDEVVAAALRLDEALAGVKHLPDVTGDDCFSTADRAAWAPEAGALDRGLEDGLNTDLIAALRAALAREPEISAPAQPVHLDMLATTLFHGTRAPAVTELVGSVRPRGFTAALAIVDGLLAEAVDDRIAERFSHVPDLRALLLRGLLYRVYIHALLPEPNRNMSSRISRVAGLFA